MVGENLKITLQSAFDRATALQKWAYDSWKLVDLQKSTIQVSEKSCWLCARKTVTQTNPAYTIAQEQARKNLYAEIVELAQEIAINNEAVSSIETITSSYPASTDDNFNRIDAAANTIYTNVNDALGSKQRNPTNSIAAQVANIKEAYAQIFSDFKQIAKETLDAPTAAQVAQANPSPQADNTYYYAAAGIVVAAIVVVFISK